MRANYKLIQCCINFLISYLALLECFMYYIIDNILGQACSNLDRTKSLPSKIS